MTGRADPPEPCPLCGGQLSTGLATIPFVLGNTVAIIKQVPAKICEACGEPYLDAHATDIVSSLLEKSVASSAEVSVMTYPNTAPVAA